MDDGRAGRRGAPGGPVADHECFNRLFPMLPDLDGLVKGKGSARSGRQEGAGVLQELAEGRLALEEEVVAPRQGDELDASCIRAAISPDTVMRCNSLNQ